MKTSLPLRFALAASFALVALLSSRTAAAETPPLLVPGVSIKIDGAKGSFDFLEIDLAKKRLVAAHTKEDGSSPFVLGPFMREAFLCEGIPDPPPGAANMARNDVPAGSTTRESLEYRTGAPLCQSCHSKFSQLGYAFLPFDPVGRWVNQDPTGKPWDLAGSIAPASGSLLAFQSPNELMTGLANEPQVHGCFGQAALKLAIQSAGILVSSCRNNRL